MKFKRCMALVLALILTAFCLPQMQEAAHAAPAYTIHVDLTNQITTVYLNGNETDSGVVRQMICSTGAAGTPTPTGTFTMPAKRYSSERKEWYYFPEFNCYAKYASRIVNGILFHSVLYSAKKVGPTSTSVNALGSTASHGCIRLRVPDAKWIAENCPQGTQVKIYYSGQRDSVLRGFLKKNSFSIDDMSYADYINAEVTLSSGNSGRKVRELQTRLTELGYSCGAIDGSFGSATQNAVLAYQAANRLPQNGKVTPELWNHIFTAPIPGREVWQLGTSGTAVSEIQTALKDLYFYSGAITGNYDAETRDAVSAYQKAFGSEVSGKVTLAFKGSLSEHAARVKAQFGDAAYKLNTTEVKGHIVQIKVAKRLHLREEASISSKSLGLLDNGTVVNVLGEAGSWMKIGCNGKVGFVMKNNLKYIETTTIVYDYIADPAQPAPEASMNPAQPTAEPTAEPTAAPTAEPTPEPTAQPTPEPIATATVNQIKSYLSLRKTASNSASVVARLYSGAKLNVLEEGAGWTKVQYGDKVGYVSTAYITISRPNQPTLAPTATPEPTPAPELIAEATVDQIKSYLSMRKTASSKASVIARLYSGNKLGVLEVGDVWIKVIYNDKIGYVDARYISIQYPATPAPTAEPTPAAEPTAAPDLAA